MREANEVKTIRARRLRRNSTNAENALWNRLRSRVLDGHKFVRQEPIGSYTVDLICRERRLIIEVDGGQHADNPRDVVRDNGSLIATIGCCGSGTTTCWATWQVSLKQLRSPSLRRPLTRIAVAMPRRSHLSPRAGRVEKHRNLSPGDCTSPRSRGEVGA